MFDVKSLKQLFLDCGFNTVRQIPIPNINRSIYSASHAVTMSRDPGTAQWQDLPEPLKRQAVREEKLYSGISPFSDAITFEGFKP
jgi:hypothetical protein